jgi:hypothetical protein
MRAPRFASPAVTLLDDGSFWIRQGARAIRLDTTQAVELVGELQRLLYPPRKTRDWDCV